jgi:hypothetical protein
MHITHHMLHTYIMALADDKGKRRKVQPAALSLTEAERIVSDQVPTNRRQEILEYLKLFGYKPDRTIIQVHIAGFFNKKRTATGREAEKRQATNNRYGGTTFVIVGRTHDPSIMNIVSKPKKKPDQTSPGYVGYLWKNMNPNNRAPHEIVPLDFTPTHVAYPDDWKNMFATKGFMLALHVPASFAKHKNKLTRALYRVGKTATVKQSWDFINEIKSSGVEHTKQQVMEYPLDILKVRLAKGEITKEEYEKLRQTLAA